MKVAQVLKEEGVKGFMSRWKNGIEKTTPLQSTQAQLLFTRITMIGILLGFLISCLRWKTAWWLAIILAGAYGNTYLSLVALKQKQKILREVEKC